MSYALKNYVLCSKNKSYPPTSFTPYFCPNLRKKWGLASMHGFQCKARVTFGYWSQFIGNKLYPFINVNIFADWFKNNQWFTWYQNNDHQHYQTIRLSTGQKPKFKTVCSRNVKMSRNIHFKALNSNFQSGYKWRN